MSVAANGPGRKVGYVSQRLKTIWVTLFSLPLRTAEALTLSAMATSKPAASRPYDMCGTLVIWHCHNNTPLQRSHCGLLLCRVVFGATGFTGRRVTKEVGACGFTGWADHFQ